MTALPPAAPATPTHALPPTPPAVSTTPPAPVTPPAVTADPGFPAATPVKDMTDAQQAAYWKHQSRKHEDRAGATADYDAVKAELDRLKALTQTDAEKAIEQARAEARTQAKAEAIRDSLPRLVKAEIKAAAAGRVPAERLDAGFDLLDLTKFLTADGSEVDADRVSQYVEGLAPDGKKWPDMGQGRRGPTTPTTGVSAGRSLYEERHPKK